MGTTKKATFIVAIVLLAIGLLTNPSNAQVTKCDGDCGGKYHGIKPTEEELKKILADHKKWYETYEPIEATEAASVPQDGRAYLCETDLSHIDLSKTDLRFAILRGANLKQANLSGADLKQADLSGADLKLANLSGADLWEANLSEAHLWLADLKKVDLTFANLSGANLKQADLSGSNLWRADFSGMDLRKADLDSVTFELKPGALPLIPDFALAENLSRMQYNESPHSLVELRDAFKKAGLRQQEREITYAIEHTARQQQLHDKEGIGGVVKGFFKLILFELTSDYGMSPGRPLLIMFGFIFFFSILYWIALKKQGGAGIWQVCQKEVVFKNIGQEEPASGEWRRIRIALYFSLLSAFHIGWRELNIGNWIIWIQPHEYALRATGWVRTVSGIQSLMSVYLLALSVLTYFGRPFE
ncbi:MAG: pentapeptide repeat-containing protein [Planctomycetes bacterium]|nr:pentapeptide repeat-containing protein [Planctomycetota bacterium]